MKIEALANGNVIEADDGAAEQLIAAGIYKKYEEPKAKADKPAGQTTRRKPQK